MVIIAKFNIDRYFNYLKFYFSQMLLEYQVGVKTFSHTIIDTLCKLLVNKTRPSPAPPAAIKYNPTD